MAHGRYPQHKLPSRQFPETLTSKTKYFAAANGVSIELVALGVRYFDDGEERRELTGYSASLDNGDGLTATVFLDANGDETPETFSELDAYPEHQGSPLEAAWQEVIDGRTETAQAFENAISSLAGELTGR